MAARLGWAPPALRAMPRTHSSRGCYKLKRGLCSSSDASLKAFVRLTERGLGVGEQMREMQQPIADSLAKRGWFACDGLLSIEDCLVLREECRALRASGLFSQSYSEVAETGERIWRANVEAMELKNDTWRSAPTLVAFLAEMMREVPPVMNDSFAALNLSSTTFGHKLAVSTGEGAFYPKHLDNSLGAPHDLRKLTAILYLNPEWDETNGGAIRLYDALTDPTHTDLAPAGNRLVLFWSDLIVHEVLPMQMLPASAEEERGHRHTFTVWIATENPACLLDGRDPLFALRAAHYPDKEE